MSHKKIAFILAIVMVCGLFWSRALLSLSMGGWLLFAGFRYQHWMPVFKKDVLLVWSICPLFLFWLGGWQQPAAMSNYDYLLTLSTYPVVALAFRSLPAKETARTGKALWLWASAVGLVYPLGWYLLHYTIANQGYGKGQSLPTFMDADHVRFGIFVSAAYLFSLRYPFTKPSYRKWIAGLLLASILFLSVRTAWVMALLITIFHLLMHWATRVSRKKMVIGGTLFVLLLLAAYYALPTVQQKVAYTVYDWQQYSPEKYDASYSDGTRRTLNQTAWKAIRQGDGANTGWAAIPESLNREFAKSHPGELLAFGWPFNQYLFWWMGAGGLGMVLFALWLLYPALYGWKNKKYALACWSLCIVLSCMVETTLNYQYGTWLHAWVLVLLWEDDYWSTATTGNS